MRKTARSLLIALSLVAFLGLPQTASAVTYEDSFEDCSYPPLLDLMLMRPVSLASFAVGTALFVVTTPITLLTATDQVGEVFDDLVSRPGRFTFVRPLG